MEADEMQSALFVANTPLTKIEQAIEALSFINNQSYPYEIIYGAKGNVNRIRKAKFLILMGVGAIQSVMKLANQKAIGIIFGDQVSSAKLNGPFFRLDFSALSDREFNNSKNLDTDSIVSTLQNMLRLNPKQQSKLTYDSKSFVEPFIQNTWVGITFQREINALSYFVKGDEKRLNLKIEYLKWLVSRKSVGQLRKILTQQSGKKPDSVNIKRICQVFEDGSNLLEEIRERYRGKRSHLMTIEKLCDTYGEKKAVGEGVRSSVRECVQSMKNGQFVDRYELRKKYSTSVFDMGITQALIEKNNLLVTL